MKLIKTITMVLALLTIQSCFYNPSRSYSSSSTSLEEKMKQNEEEVKAVLNSWMGSHKSEIIRSWGPPDRYADDGKGGEIMIWEDRKMLRFNYGNSIMEKVITYTKSIFVDADGEIYFGRYQRY